MTADDPPLHGVAETLAYALSEAAPPAEIKRRLLSRIGDRGHYVLHAADDSWEATHVDGLERRTLFIDPSTGEMRMLVRLAAGTELPDARELGACEVLVVSGKVRWAAASLDRGDYHRTGTATPAAGLVAEADAVLLFTAPRLARAGIRGTSPVPPAPSAPEAPIRSRTVSAPSVAWQTLAPGVSERVLAADRARGLRFSIVRMDAGASVASSGQAGVEELFLLEGDCRCAERELAPGDYYRGGADSIHRITATARGCLMFMITRIPEAA